MEYLQVLPVSLLSIVVLFILTKLMGYKQVSQLSMFDYIIGISIGSIAAEMATELEQPYQPLIAMAVYGIVAYLISLAGVKSGMFRRNIFGKATVLFDNGKLYEENFKKAKLELNEFLMLCRNSGYFDISTLQTIILESNGKLSFLPKAADRPVTTADLNISPTQELVFANVIEDGNIMHKNLKYSGVNEDWLSNELKRQNISSAADVFLGVCTTDKKLNAYLKQGKKVPNDILE